MSDLFWQIPLVAAVLIVGVMAFLTISMVLVIFVMTRIVGPLLDRLGLDG